MQVMVDEVVQAALGSKPSIVDEFEYPRLRSMQGLKYPVVVIIGRPNVGKSTLFNRICGTRKALVGDESGITRDRNAAPAEWRGTSFEIIDTGGIIPGDDALIPTHILSQARTALDVATVVYLVVDGRVGVTPIDSELAQILLKTSKTIFVVVNKCDTTGQELNAHQFYELGFERVIPVSAEHGNNLGDLLDETLEFFPSVESSQTETERVISISIIGKPNVGKSTLLNRLAGEERVIVSPVPGTTRDAIDTTLCHEGKIYRLIDTAGIRKKSQTYLVAEKISVVMARKSLERCDVALVVLDGLQEVTAMDATIAGYAHEAGVSVILVVNKWDLVTKDTHTMHEQEKEIRHRLKYLDYAPILFISALIGQRTHKLFALIDQLYTARHKRISTSQLNDFLQTAALQKAALPANRQVKVHYMTQVGVAPPRFALFTNSRGPIHFSLERYLINQIRERFDFVGTPIIIKQKYKHDRAGNSR
jgi:GTP-binding protein